MFDAIRVVQRRVVTREVLVRLEVTEDHACIRLDGLHVHLESD